MTATIERLQELGALSTLDVSFARSVSRIAGETRPEVAVAAALVSRQAGRGDVCLDLGRFAEDEARAAGLDGIAWPETGAWAGALRASDLVGAPGRDAAAPLVLDGERLYLRRLWADESHVAASFSERATIDALPQDDPGLEESIARLLPGSGPGAEAPRRAARVAAQRGLCVLAGRPGTGKTTVAAKLLAVLVEKALRAGEAPPRIALAAPTGKAAARLSTAITSALASLDCSEEVREAVPRVASTLHRLLGSAARARRARRLEADVVLVDEASMVDLALMARLVRALAPAARLLLLGDPDQLASVEAGAVFADLAGVGVAEESPARAQSKVAASVVELVHSHRYARGSGIGRLAEAMRAGEVDEALALLADPSHEDVRWLEGAGSLEAISRSAVAAYAPFARAQEPAARLRALERFRVLAALREGPRGIESLQWRIEAGLVAEGGLPPVGARSSVRPGRPLLVTRNAPQLGLWNGDAGVVGLGAAAGRVWFERAEGGLREVAASRLPAHESLFAMSVHKSQGSELDEVLLVLPDEPHPLLTRELVYTAVTRARKRVLVAGRESVLAAALGARVRRRSGLRAALWPGAEDRGTV